MKYKKHISILLASLMFMFCLTGCSSNKTNTENSSDNKSSGNASADITGDGSSKKAETPDTTGSESNTESGAKNIDPEINNDEKAGTETKTERRMEKYESLITTVPEPYYDQEEDGVNYPQFKKYTYYSTTAERDTNVNVLLPADYTEDKKYPVLYILHGFYDSEEWMARKVVALSQILTNLQNKGEAEEMIVVLPYIYCSKESQYVTGMDLKNCLAYDNFINDLTTDLMPFIEKNFSVATGRENTAITGFSMGGRESLFIGFKHPELFSYIGAVCPAPGLVKVNGSGMHPGQMLASEMVFPEKEKPALLLISSSKADGTVTTFPDSYRNILKSNNEEFISQVMATTGHDHTSVKPHLYCFLKMIFR